MAYVVRRNDGRWEIRESQLTDVGPRSRTLASFRVLTSEVVTHAVERSRLGLDEAQLDAVVQRAGLERQDRAADRAARALLAEIRAGRTPSALLSAQLAEVLGRRGLDQPGSAHPDTSEALRGATAVERGLVIHDLLGLADRLPARHTASLLFPPLGKPTLERRRQRR
jgi:hypothetical protein